MAQWKAATTRAPPRTKAELREMLTEAVRNTQTGDGDAPKRQSTTKTGPDAAPPLD